MNVIARRGIAAIILAAAACGGTDNEPERVALGSAGAAALSEVAATVAGGDTVTVWKSPTCGCCSKWVDHMRDAGFTVVTNDIDDVTPIKRQLGVPAGRTSCHTASVRGYALEGHVPADLVQRLISEKPAGVRGLAVPGMPMGSPGMEGIVNQQYDVLAFDEAGDVTVYDRR